MRRMLILIIAGTCMIAGVGSAAVFLPAPAPEQLVEGHTVFSIIEKFPCTCTNGSRFAAAVAILVRDVEVSESHYRFPGVLWFNDQYLVDGSKTDQSPLTTVRYPCSGSVLAVRAGDPDPRVYSDADFYAGYVESYYISDPNNHVWNVDKWNVNGSLVWSVALNGNDPLSDSSDDGECSGPPPYQDGGGLCQTRLFNNTCVPGMGPDSPGGPYTSVGDNGYFYPCGDPSATCNLIQYNALLYFQWEDLNVDTMVKDHTPGSPDRRNDVSGCQNGTYQDPSVADWPCPVGDDDREGNSHAYGPDNGSAVFLAGWPFGTDVGRDNHGGSADCNNDTTPDQLCHATAMIDIYFDNAPVPLSRQYAVYDAEGNSAPFYCEGTAPCDQNDSVLAGYPPIPPSVPPTPP